MKMIYAGLTTDPNARADKWRYNCTRNVKCQRSFNIPIKSVNDLQLYFELPFMPDSYLLTLIDCDGIERTLTPCAYVIGSHPFGWYGVFQGLRLGDFDSGTGGRTGDFNRDFNGDFLRGYFNELPRISNDSNCDYNGDFNEDFDICQDTGECGDFSEDFNNDFFNDECPFPKLKPLSCFYIKAVFFSGGDEAVFFSNDICIEKCDPLGLVEACYNDPTPGSLAYDNNDVYYGFPLGADYLGIPTLRYYHKLYVRKYSVLETKTKLSFQVFNSKRTYKTTTNRIWNFASELVPTFYKNEIISVLARGNININGLSYRLADEVDLSPVGEDIGFWDMQVPLTEFKDTFFSCKPTNCKAPLEALCNNNFTASINWNNVFHLLTISFTGGALSSGESLHVIVKKNGKVISDQTLTTINNIVLLTALQDNCYTVEWQKDCGCNMLSEIKTLEYNCGEPSCCAVSVYSALSIFTNGHNQLAIEFMPCQGANNYTLFYRPKGTTGEYRSVTGFETGAVMLVDDTVESVHTDYEGYIITNCLNGQHSEHVNFDTSSVIKCFNYRIINNSSAINDLGYIDCSGISFYDPTIMNVGTSIDVCAQENSVVSSGSTIIKMEQCG